MDMPRAFSDKEKRHLYLAGEGRCARCGEQLGEEWDAHHVTLFSRGGTTAITNAAAVCKACHAALHRGGKMKPRAWQDVALRIFNNTEKTCLIEATPGSGKTVFSGLCAQEIFAEAKADFAVIVVPTTALKGDADAGFLGDWHRVGIEITTVLKEGRGRPREFQGGVITYQQLTAGMVSTLETWAKKNGERLMFVFDEIHHASESNLWGDAAERCSDVAVKVLAMTGTPFRGDGRRIKFLQYDGDGNAVADYRYRYRDAVRDRVCRPVEFITDDGLAQFAIKEIEQLIAISETKEEDAGKVSAVIFNKDSDWLRRVIEKADAKLDDYRTMDGDAGGLVICRPGLDDVDDRHLHQVAKLVKQVTGEDPEVITHEDDDANAKIERYRRGSTKWICSVRKISEGVDIKRLRVEVMATRPGTELLFRQLVGRIVRVDDVNRPGDATVFLAKFPQLQDWAERITEEAKAGLRDSDSKKRERGEDQEETDFRPLGATHQDGGAVSVFGEVFAPNEVDYAEHLKRDDPELRDVSVTKLAHILRKLAIEIPQNGAEQEPKAIQKKKLRAEINTLHRRLAIQLNPKEPNFGLVWRDTVTRWTGARNADDLMDNHPIEVSEQVKALFLRKLAEAKNADAA